MNECMDGCITSSTTLAAVGGSRGLGLGSAEGLHIHVAIQQASSDTLNGFHPLLGIQIILCLQCKDKLLLLYGILCRSSSAYKKTKSCCCCTGSRVDCLAYTQMTGCCCFAEMRSVGCHSSSDQILSADHRPAHMHSDLLLPVPIQKEMYNWWARPQMHILITHVICMHAYTSSVGDGILRHTQQGDVCT